MLVGAQSGGVRTLVADQSALTAALGASQSAEARWDLTGGAFSVVQVPPALAYSWSADGSLMPTLTLAAHGAPAPNVAIGPVGNPIGDASFTLWQHGELSYVTQCPPQPGQPAQKPFAPYYTLDLRSSAISPDGRYLLDTVYAYGLLPVQGVTPPPVDLNAGGGGCYVSLTPDAARLPAMPLRDVALLHTAGTMNETNQQVALAWSPDGHYLAAGQQKTTGTQDAIVVRDCASGKMVAQLAGGALGTSVSFDGTHDVQHFAWAPAGRGHTLAVLVTNTQTLILWRL
ncbi:MAG: hypothetical protein ACHQ4H_01925 [Ktedonobacterales bacterium]